MIVRGRNLNSKYLFFFFKYSTIITDGNRYIFLYSTRVSENNRVNGVAETLNIKFYRQSGSSGNKPIYSNAAINAYQKRNTFYDNAFSLRNCFFTEFDQSEYSRANVSATRPV